MSEQNGQGTRVEETGLSTVTEKQSASLVGAAAKEQHEIQSAILIAKRMPRNEQEAFGKLMKAAARPSFAEDAAYRFPRGTKEDGSKNYVEGPSINVAREAARVWGNIRYGLYVVEDIDDFRKIRGWAWDLESNTRIEMDDEFEKSIQRKQQGKTVWVKPDERDLRELTNRRGAILVRNCLLQLLPKDMIEDALDRCKCTLETKSKEDPEGARKRVIAVFADVNVTVSMLEEKLGKALLQCTPAELTDLRKVGVSIRDGQMTWAEYAGEVTEKKAAEQDKLKSELAAAQEKLKAQREAKAKPADEPVKDAAIVDPDQTTMETPTDETTEGSATMDISLWTDLNTAWQENNKDEFQACKKTFGVRHIKELPANHRVSFRNTMGDLIKAAAK